MILRDVTSDNKVLVWLMNTLEMSLQIYVDIEMSEFQQEMWHEVLQKSRFKSRKI